MRLLTRLAGRLAVGAVLVAVLVDVTWVLFDRLPGGPFTEERRLDPADEARLRARYGLDDPVWRRAATYLAGLARGDLGPCLSHRDWAVQEVLAGSARPTMALGACALALALAIGIPAGLVSAARRGTGWDRLLLGGAVLGLALPNFVLAGLLVLVFSSWLGWLPPAGWEGGRHLVLPAVSLGLPFAAVFARLVRASALEVLGTEFVRTARAKGLPPSRVLFVHVLRPSLVPVLAFLGPAAAAVLTGSLVVEQVFAVPGLGSHFVAGAMNRDPFLVLGTAVVYFGAVIACNTAADALLWWADPRVREGRP